MNGIEKFAARLDEDQGLRTQLKEVRGSSREAVVREIAAVAEGAGIELSVEELERAFGGASARSDELAMDELGKMSGGGTYQFDPRLQAKLRARLSDGVLAVLGDA